MSFYMINRLIPAAIDQDPGLQLEPEEEQILDGPVKILEVRRDVW